MTAECPHFTSRDIPTCLAPSGQKFSSFEEFLLSKQLRAMPKLFPIYSQCLTRNGTAISITDGCIGCLHCVFGCPSHSGQIDVEILEVNDPCCRVRIRVADSCGFSTEESRLRENWMSMGPFSGSVIELDGADISRQGFRFSDFDSFLAEDETERIAVWVATACSAIFGESASISRELPIKVSAKPRDGRIDVGVNLGQTAFAIETKTDFESAMNENRFDVQIRNYQIELDAVSSRLKLRPIQQLLVFGGDETKMLPSTHPMCTSREGGQADDFYSRILDINAPLVSAQALLLLGFRSLFDRSVAAALDSLLRDRTVLAILTAGVVKRSRGVFEVVSAPTLRSD